MKKHLRLLPLIILTTLIAYTLTGALLGSVNPDNKLLNYSFTFSHSLALCAIILCWVFVRFKPPFYMPAISTILLMGIFSIFNFTPAQWTFSGSASLASGMFSLSIGFQLPSFLIAILHLIINYKELKVLYDKTAPKEERQVGNSSNSKVAFFKKQFRNKSMIQLENILQEPNKYQPDALEAARQLLAEQKG